jgi:tRNA(Ile)-lysidine synthetase-like protein
VVIFAKGLKKMITKIKKFIEEENLIKGNKVILAFSYGIDSRVLLDILLKLNYEVVLAHVNHKVRKESDLEEKEVLKLSETLNLKCYIKHLDKIEGSFEGESHKQRYDFFKEISLKENTNEIVTAHHLHDQFETILMNLITGSNLYGYSGINPLLIKDNLHFIRPLLCVSKKEIKDYQEKNNLLYFEDYTNHTNFTLRNRIRNNILPLFSKEGSQIYNKVKDYNEILLESFNFIRNMSINYLKENKNIINISSFKILDKALRHDIICLMLENLKINRTRNLILEIDLMINSLKPNSKINLSNCFSFKKAYNKAFIEKENDKKDIEYDMYFSDTIELDDARLYFTKNKAPEGAIYIKLCYNNLKFPLKIRHRKNGDKINMNYGHKKVKDLFIDLKLERALRDKAIVVLNDDEIIWIPGYAKSYETTKNKDIADCNLIYEVKHAK